MSEEAVIRERICRIGASLFSRGLTFGSSGNISVRLEDGFLTTPTNVALGDLDPARLSRLDAEGRWLGGDKPTKETFLHLAMYRERPGAGAVVHTHSTYSVAASILEDVDPADVLPPLTAYYVMRVGTLPLVPYYAPGDERLAAAVAERAGRHHAVLLSNHGPVVAGSDLSSALNCLEELEETAKLHLLLHGRGVRCLTCDQAEDLRKRFPS